MQHAHASGVLQCTFACLLADIRTANGEHNGHPHSDCNSTNASQCAMLAMLGVVTGCQREGQVDCSLDPTAELRHVLCWLGIQNVQHAL